LCGGRNDAARWAAIRQGAVAWPKAGKAFVGQTGGVFWLMDYSAVSVAVRRFSERIAKDTELRRELEEIQRQMSKVEM
jgi:hypothetical protein